MTMSWKARRPERLDRYLDWEVVNRSLKGKQQTGLPLGQRWCSVLVQVPPGPPDKPAANLERLRQEVEQKSDVIRMLGDERALLDDVTTAVQTGNIQPEADDGADGGNVRLQFFVYLREDGAYHDGEYRRFEHFRIRLVGPPIESLIFNNAFKATDLQLPTAGFIPPTAIGIIDDGIAFAHQQFRAPAGADAAGGQRTRIVALWLQDLETATPDNGVAFGQRLEAKDINALLQKSAASTSVINDIDVYRRAGQYDFAREAHKPIAFRTAHGTHVMDLACGHDPRDVDGRAPPILAVQLPNAVTADTSGVNMGSYVLQALRLIMLWADKLDRGGPAPLVVNFSYGILAGPKDGTHYLEREIDRLVNHRNKTRRTTVVLPAGNAYRDRTTAQIALEVGSTKALDWVLLPDDGTPSYLEIWFEREAVQGISPPVEIALTPPGSHLIGRNPMPARGRCCVLERGGEPVYAIYYDGPEAGLGSPRTGDCRERAQIASL